MSAEPAPPITRDHGVFLTGTASWLPRQVPVTEEVEQGRCAPETASASEMLSVTVAEGEEVAAELAVRAAHRLWQLPGCDPAQVGLMLHATCFEQGLEVWAPASYVQRRALGGNRCPAVEVRQASNGGLAAMYLAAGWLTAFRSSSSVLITTADRFALPSSDRWEMDPGTVYADGGTATILSTTGGFARILGLSVVSGAELEGLHRPGEPDGPAVADYRRPVDLTSQKKNFLRLNGLRDTLAAIEEGQRLALDAALAAAEVKLADIDWFVLPHFIRKRLQSNYLRPLGIDLAATTWAWNRQVGHLGPGDQFASLEHLQHTGKLQPGARCLLMAVGAGFSWSCAVVSIEDPAAR
ncbi:hypothetical protein GCM10022222_54820 [Amycolatopsis ultiminotia]|uniref:Beta-ketoacyl-[acyl-carrier-protein] synthase III C-terminal domain-containing protein n=1 Tax=Amycolatopsis ultiminotia TaxID=543629 RepID=A0ABP6XER9_9PSEU